MYSEEIIEELNEIYEFFKEVDKYKRIWNDPIKSYTVNGETITLHTNSSSPFIHSKFCNFLINYYNKIELPQKLNDEVFENMNSTILYRGEKKANFARNLIQDKHYHIGDGNFGTGIYTTRIKMFATSFGRVWADKDPGICVKYKINPNSLIISYELLNELRQISELFLKGKNPNIENIDIINKEKFKALLNFLNNKNDNVFNECFINNNSNALAIYLGYDVLYAQCQEFVIFNRSKLCLSQSEYNRVIEQAKKETSEPTEETLEIF